MLVSMRSILLGWCVASVSSLIGSEVSPEMRDMLKQFQKLEEITKTIQQHYVEPVSREDLWQGTVQGILTNLDPSCRFMTAREMALRGRSRQDQTHGFGFDWDVDAENNRIEIIRVLPQSPAAKAGLVRGDTLLAVNGAAVEHMSLRVLRDAFLSLQEQCTLSLRHADGTTYSVEMQKADLNDSGLGSVMMVDKEFGIGLIQLTRFIGESANRTSDDVYTKTGVAFRKALAVMEEQGLRALILDLRGNGGGDVRAAAEVADSFLDASPDDGTIIVSLTSRHPGHQQIMKAKSNTTFPLWPVTVLVDKHTGSSAEICAAALREHGRAVLIGEPTKGKASVQRLLKLSDGSAIQLTVARYRTPHGKDIHQVGLTPDVRVADTNLDRLARAQDSQGPDAPRSRARDVLVGMLIGTQGRIGLDP